MNNQQRKGAPLLARTLELIILVMFFNLAAAINSPVKAADTAQTDIECLFNWAQTFKYAPLFSPPVSGLQFSSPYTYRHYLGTDSYVGVSSADNHVYYLGPGVPLQDAQDVGTLSFWLTQSGCGARPYPVIFIHGIASSADTWIPFRDYLINSAGWTFGGIPAYNPGTKTVDISCPSDLSLLATCTGDAGDAGDFYTLNFSDNQGLSFDVQGGELAAIIKAVLAANPGKTKVLLVGHSTGGLAAREYLQGLGALDSVTTIPYRQDVAKLITVGTPHQGSFWAETCHLHFDIFGISGNIGICDLLSLSVDPNSIAIKELQPNSQALNILNYLAPPYNLPYDVSYVSIKGKGQPTLDGLDFLTIAHFTTGDGIVSDASQNLKTVTGNLPLQQNTVSIDILFQTECGNKIHVPIIGNLGENHTCEPKDLGVWGEVLSDVYVQ